MVPLEFIISLAGATMLLLYAVRQVQTGIERAFGASFKRVVTRNKNPVKAAAVGTFLAILLQSSVAVTLLVSEFAAAGSIGIAAGIAAVIGADLGSAIVVKILSLRVDWLVPVLLAVGGGLFLKTQAKSSVQAGRILLGLGFILLSLRLLRETMEPIQQSAFLPVIAAYLESDPISAFMAGAVLAFVMHSSVAVILMCVTLLAISAFPFSVGVSLVLGANLGSALIPVWLTRGKELAARRIPFANLFIRGSFAIVALLLWHTVQPDQFFEDYPPETRLLLVHIGFNAALIVFLPLVGLIENLFVWLLPDQTVQGSAPESPLEQSALDQKSLETPALALACLRREVMRMMQLVEVMISPVMQHYEDGDLEAIAASAKLDRHVNESLSGIRQFVIEIHEQDLTKAEKREVGSLMESAINLESAGDVVTKRLLKLARKKTKRGIKFSEEGWLELVRIHEQVVANTRLASNVLVTENLESARLLVEEKSDLAKRERLSRKQHLKRIQAGTELSLESSDLHLETLRALREFGSQVSSVAYPILDREGQLLESRLIAAQ